VGAGRLILGRAQYVLRAPRAQNSHEFRDAASRADSGNLGSSQFRFLVGCGGQAEGELHPNGLRIASQ
jgi:hypothetical protein